MAIVNVRLMSHPMNWLTVLLMALIAGIAGHLLLSFFGIEPGDVASGGGGGGRVLSFGSMPAGQAPGEERAGAISPQMAPIAINSIRS